jgi:hypothetical protein
VGSFADKLAAALALPPPIPPGPVQIAFNTYIKQLVGQVVRTPLPEDVHFLEENFPYLIQLENPDPSNPSEWVPAKASFVVPLLQKGNFNENGFRFDARRAHDLVYLPDFLRKPDCIHRNLRHGLEDGISGHHMYVKCLRKRHRKVAFSIRNDRVGKVVVVSSFPSYKNWVAECAEMPARYARAGCTCGKIEKATSEVASSTPMTLGPE